MGKTAAFRHLNPYVIPAGSVVFGAVLLVFGLSIPEYAVPNGRELLFNKSWEDQELRGHDPRRLVQQWDALRDKLQTRHFLFCDIGSGLIGLGLSVTALLIAKKIRTACNLREMTTPPNRLRFHVYATLAWLSFVPTQMFYLTCMAAREDPPFVDNMAIPIESELTLLFGLVGLPVILFGVWIVTRNKSLPVPMWAGRNGSHTSLPTAAVWIALILAVLVTAGCLFTEPPLVPSCVFTVYLLLCGRAASVSPAAIRQVVGFEVVAGPQREEPPVGQCDTTPFWRPPEGRSSRHSPARTPPCGRPPKGAN